MSAEEKVGDTWEPDGGPHQGHTITAVAVRPNIPDPDVVDVECSCGSKWSYESEAGDEEEEHDEESCAEPDCEQAEEWQVYVETSISFTVRAHSEEKAQEWAEEVADRAITIRDDTPILVGDWSEDGVEVSVRRSAEVMAERARRTAETNRILAEMKDEAGG